MYNMITLNSDEHDSKSNKMKNIHISWKIRVEYCANNDGYAKVVEKSFSENKTKLAMSKGTWNMKSY